MYICGVVCVCAGEHKNAHTETINIHWDVNKALLTWAQGLHA